MIKKLYLHNLKLWVITSFVCLFFAGISQFVWQVLWEINTSNYHTNMYIMVICLFSVCAQNIGNITKL